MAKKPTKQDQIATPKRTAALTRDDLDAIVLDAWGNDGGQAITKADLFAALKDRITEYELSGAIDRCIGAGTLERDRAEHLPGKPWVYRRKAGYA